MKEISAKAYFYSLVPPLKKESNLTNNTTTHHILFAVEKYTVILYMSGLMLNDLMQSQGCVAQMVNRGTSMSIPVWELRITMMASTSLTQKCT